MRASRFGANPDSDDNRFITGAALIRTLRGRPFDRLRNRAMGAVRCFVAIELDDGARASLARLQQRLDGGARDVRWVRVEQLHLTLKFLGDVDERDLSGISDMLAELADHHDPIDVQVRGAGCFPPRGAVRIVWAGLHEPTGRLEKLQADCEALFAGLGFKQEHRRFAPHVTIGRARPRDRGDAVRRRVEKQSGFEGGVVPVEEIVLFQSLPGRESVKYVALSRHTLGGT
ncbi:MAG: RNA 2',3'-cyclic phosphodiesterase [Phycisphaerae bacterium]